MSEQSPFTPEQKKSLIRWGLIFYFAALVWPLIHQVLSEEVAWEPGSFSNALFKASKLVVNFLLLYGLFMQIQRAIGLAEGTWGRKSNG